MHVYVNTYMKKDVERLEVNTERLKSELQAQVYICIYVFICGWVKGSTRCTYVYTYNIYVYI